MCFFSSTVFALDKVDINTATLQQLDTLTGIGPTYAQRIIDGRPYSSVDDLDRVKGIGPATLQKIKDQGLAYVSGQTMQAPQAPAVTENIAVANNTTPTQTPTTEPIGATTKQPGVITPTVYPSGVFINEIMPNPSGADETDEWVELYNSNNFDVNISGWKIQDMTGTVTTYIINPSAGSGQAKILANDFLTFKRPDTKIMLNNDEDGLNLLAPNNKVVDSVAFSKAPLNQSYNKTSGVWTWSNMPTPGAKNIIPAKTPSSVSKTLPNVKNSVKNDGVAALSQTIDLNQEDTSTNNPWFLFFTVLVATIILAIIVLLIKLNIFKSHVRT